MSRTSDISVSRTSGNRTCAVLSALAVAVLLFCGCASPRAPDAPPDFALPEREARQAGALALYAKGILLENTESGDTNANKRAATEAFQQAVILDPDSRSPIEALVNNLEEEKRYADALAALESFLVRQPDDEGLRIEAARMAEILGRPAAAARHCELLVANAPGRVEITLSLIRFYYQADKPDEAIRVMRDLHSRFPGEHSLAIPVSWAIHFTGEGNNPERALACLNLAITQRTNDTERAALMAVIAENHLKLGNTNTAETVFLEAYRTDPSSRDAILRLGAIWADRPGATNQLARAIQQERDPHTTRLILAATHHVLGNHAAAADTLNEAYQHRMRAGYFPSESFYLWHASLLEGTQQTQKAERILLDAIAAHPTSHEALNFLAYMWAEQDTRLDDADRLINQVLRAVPENAAYLDTKGWVLFKKGRFYDALQFLLKAAGISKRDPEIFDHIGDTLKAVGHESEAIVFWTHSHEIKPSPAIAEKLRLLGEQ